MEDEDERLQAMNQKSDDLLAQMEAAERAGDEAKVKELGRQFEQLLEKQYGPIPASEKLPGDYDAFFDALVFGEEEEIKKYLSQGIELNVAVGALDSVPLQQAMMRDGRSATVIQMLLDAGADAAFATNDGFTALHYVADTNFPDDS